MANLRDKVRERQQPKRSSSPAKGKKPAAAAQPALDFNPRLLMIAAGVAGLAALLAVLYLANASADIAGKGAKVSVWVTKDAVEARHAITEDDVETRDVPQNFLADGYLTKDDSPIGKVALAPLAKGEVLLKIRLAIPGRETGVTPKLKPSERGFVYIPEGAQDVPLVKPDDTVDLIATLPEPGNDRRMISTQVAQLVRVLSVGDRLSNDASASGDPQTDNGAITLAVPADKVSLLTILKQEGNLHFALRAPGDHALVKPAIPESQLAGLVTGQIPHPQPHYVPPPRPHVIVREHVVHERPRYTPPVHHAAPAHHDAPHVPHVEIYNGAQKQN